MLAGSKTPRMIVASINTATAKPTPNCFSRSNDRVMNRLVVLDPRLTGTSLATRPVIARLVEGAESIPHELVCLGVHLPRHPTDAEALEPSAETAGNFVQRTEMCFFHRGDTVHLVHHELRVREDPDVLDPVSSRKHQPLDQRLVLRHVVGGRTDRLRDLSHVD